MNYSLHVFFMVKHIILLLVLSIGLFFSYEISFAEVSETIIVTNCDGTRVSRTEAGQLVVTHIEAYSPGCVWGSRASESKQSNTESQKNTDSTIVITNCSGMRVTRTGTRVMITRAQKHLENCIMTNTGESDHMNLEKYNTDHGPALDIRSTDIVHYRTLQMKNKWIRYVNPTRSVKSSRGEYVCSREGISDEERRSHHHRKRDMMGTVCRDWGKCSWSAIEWCPLRYDRESRWVYREWVPQRSECEWSRTHRAGRSGLLEWYRSCPGSSPRECPRSSMVWFPSPRNPLESDRSLYRLDDR